MNSGDTILLGGFLHPVLRDRQQKALDMRLTRAQKTISLDAVTRSYLESEFQKSFYEAAVVREPNNLECLVELGDLYSRQGHYEKSLEIDNRLLELCPEEPIFHYNLACTLSLLNRCAQSLHALRLSLSLGYDDFSAIEQDEDLENVRNTQAFQELMLEHFR